MLIYRGKLIDYEITAPTSSRALDNTSFSTGAEVTCRIPELCAHPFNYTCHRALETLPKVSLLICLANDVNMGYLPCSEMSASVCGLGEGWKDWDRGVAVGGCSGGTEVH